MINIPDDCGYQVVGNMMRSSENCGKRKRTTRMDIMEPSLNASTEHYAIGIIVSRPYAPVGAKKEGDGECHSSYVCLFFFIFLNYSFKLKRLFSAMTKNQKHHLCDFINIYLK